MIRICYTEDFSFRLFFSGSDGKRIDLHELEWKLRFWTVDRANCVSFDSRNPGTGSCRCIKDGKGVRIVMDDHHLAMGEMMCDLCVDIPDIEYSDGFRHREWNDLHTGLRLVTGVGNHDDNMVVVICLEKGVSGLVRRAGWNVPGMARVIQRSPSVGAMDGSVYRNTGYIRLSGSSGGYVNRLGEIETGDVNGIGLCGPGHRPILLSDLPVLNADNGYVDDLGDGNYMANYPATEEMYAPGAMVALPEGIISPHIAVVRNPHTGRKCFLGCRVEEIVTMQSPPRLREFEVVCHESDSGSWRVSGAVWRNAGKSRCLNRKIEMEIWLRVATRKGRDRTCQFRRQHIFKRCWRRVPAVGGRSRVLPQSKDQASRPDNVAHRYLFRVRWGGQTPSGWAYYSMLYNGKKIRDAK